MSKFIHELGNPAPFIPPPPPANQAISVERHAMPSSGLPPKNRLHHRRSVVVVVALVADYVDDACCNVV